MTFIAAITSHHTIWLVADRRLSRRGRPPQDDARKILFLETTDGVAILGYSGLGATAGGIESSDWMGRVLRGRNLSLEQSLGVIADAMKAQFPRHLRSTALKDIASHVTIAPAFVGKHTRLYSIDMAVSGSGTPLGFRYTRFTNGRVDWPPRFGFTGSGSSHLPRGSKWHRQILQLVNAHDRGRVSAHVVADALAALSYDVHQRDCFTGPNCIVAWRYAQHGRHKGGGAQAFYERTSRVKGGTTLPTIGRGRDMGAFIQALLPFMGSQLGALMRGEPDPGIDVAAMMEAVNKLPITPDENLT